MRLFSTGLLEMVRALFIFVVLYFVFGAISNYFLETFTNRPIGQLTEEYPYLMYFLALQAIGIAILIFILYRNKFQITGWFKGKQVKPLSKTTTRILVVISVAFILAIYIVVGFGL
ncbi:hypothetical protein J32TS6_36460 [Virgibacillus pantothenticus]|uniref:hypothetical protein n=1 Tax=Virgibacillus pantothenticus TaxID=1473 RepID=UPI001B0A1E4E|nr:hypothetical protein [Virgibacillus pantothenticus]GIP65091.1 hypothetical protein J32TS6_36460 [Virgibacillus pantothenticus]